MLNIEYLRQVLDYDPMTGVFTHKTFRSPKAIPGSRAGRINTGGHRQIGIDGTRYMAHRLAWFYIYGSWPESSIDHINGVKDDNRITNLRVVTHKQNMENQCLHVNNSSGKRGISWHKTNKKWVAYLNHNGERLYLGSFDQIDSAVQMVKQARDELFTHHKTGYAA